MREELEILLEEAIDKYNEEVLNEDLYLYWWDVLNEIGDLTDEAEVITTIIAIEREADRMASRRYAGY